MATRLQCWASVLQADNSIDAKGGLKKDQTFIIVCLSFPVFIHLVPRATYIRVKRRKWESVSPDEGLSESWSSLEH